MINLAFMGHGTFENAKKSQGSQQFQETIEKIVSKSHKDQKKSLKSLKDIFCVLNEINYRVHSEVLK